MKKSSALILALTFFIAGAGLTMLVANNTISGKDQSAAAVLAMNSTGKVLTSRYVLLQNGMCNYYVQSGTLDGGYGDAFLYQSIPLQVGQTTCPPIMYGYTGSIYKFQSGYPKLVLQKDFEILKKSGSLKEFQASPTFEEAQAALKANAALKR